MSLLLFLIFLAWLILGIDFIFGIIFRIPVLKSFPHALGGEPDSGFQTKYGYPKISIIFAARNEARHLEAALQSLLTQNYPNYEVIAVNDRSTDETLAIMQKFSYDRLKILNITELPEGWLGKNHALYQGFLASQGDWLLFTDADVRFEPDTLKSCLAEVQKKQADHLALLPAMISKGLLETVFAISFALAFFFRYRPWAVSNKHSKTHVGVGAFNLVRRETYVNIGTHKALALQVLDDMELGRRIKRAGFRQLCASGSRLISVPWVEGWRGVIRSLEKNGFAAFNYQLLRTGFLSFISILMNVFPFWFFLTGNSSEKFLSGNIIFIIALCYAAFSKIFPRAFISFFFHPLGILLVLAVVWRSVFLALRDRGIRWRETFYSLEDLKEHL